MKRAILIFTLLICVVLLTNLFISCSEPAPTTTTSQTTPTTTVTQTPKAGGIFRLISNEQPSALGVPDLVKTAGMQYVSPMLESLVHRDIVDGKITFVGILAESWEWAPDYQSITFKLRQGVKFHDGTDFNAEAVKWNFQNRLEQNMPRAADVESVDVIDEYTVRYNLVDYTSLFLLNLEDGNGFGPIISPTAYDENGREWATWNPVGTGPFKFKSWEQDVSLEMERFDDYWGGKALLDGVTCVFIADSLTAQMSFENGDGDRLYLISRSNELATYFEPMGYPIAWADSGLQNMIIPSSKVEGSPWAIKEVRQALDYAIDKEQICESIGNGYWTPQYSMHVYSEPTNFQPRMYDPEKAKELLANAGYPDGFTTTFYVGTHFAGPSIAAIQDYLNDVGIKTEIEQITPQKWIELEQGPVGWGDGLMFSGGGATGIKDWATFTNYMYINMYSGGGRWNMTIERPAEIEAMGAAFLKIHDEAEALPAAQAMDAAVYDFAMFIPLWVSKDCFILQKSVMDYKKYVSPSWNFTGCWLDK